MGRNRGFPREISERDIPRVFVFVLSSFFVGAVIFSAFYTVEPDEVAVVLRFGKYSNTYEPGLHFKWPLGIDQVHKVKVAKIRTEEFGFRTRSVGVRSTYASAGFQEESLMLTGDLNTADVEWIIQYKVGSPTDYLFHVRDKRKNLRDVSESVLRSIVGDRSIDEILTIGRTEIEVEVKTKMQEILDKYRMGVEVTLVKLQNVTPPDPVAPSFNEVNESRQEKEQMINDALAEYNKTIPRVEGEAQQRISEAEGYAIDVVNTSKGDVAKFQSILKEYEKAEEITRTRLFLETMSEVYGRAGKKVLVDEDLKSILPLLNLDEVGK